MWNIIWGTWGLEVALKAYIPEVLKDYLYLQMTRRRFPQAKYLLSHQVSKDAELGQGVGIGRLVVVNAGVSIGDHTYINRGAIIFSGSVGPFCSIAHNAMIGGEQHPTDHFSTSPMTYGTGNVAGANISVNEFPSPPVIGADVWVGGGAIIMQGVRVGHGAIIAAGAVVTKDVDPYTIVAGVPAKPLRTRFDPTIIDALLASRWWETPSAELHKLRPLIEAGAGWTSDLLPVGSK